MYYGIKENRADEIKKTLTFKMLYAATDFDFPEEILEQLQRWSLLYDIPLEWLCPKAERLPPESLRFFQVDLNWIAAMLDGSLSLGRKSDFTQLLQNQYKDQVVLTALESNVNVRQRLLKKTKMIQKKSNSELELPQMSGFFLFSKIVSDCPGLEIEVFNQQGQILDMLRMERLQDSLLMCIVKGEIACILLKGAPENFHFECEEDNSIRMRNMDTGEPENSEVKLAFHDESFGTIDFAATAQAMMDAAKTDIFTSAEFAMEWMNHDYRGRIEIGRE